LTQVLGLLRPGVAPRLHGFGLFVVVVPLSFGSQYFAQLVEVGA
jgi:hypothetical protein